MKWVSVSNGSTGQLFELMEGEKKLARLSISNKTKISRIECDNEKRMFFMERTGFLQSRTIIKNEYGIRMGELTGETRESAKGIIELDGKRFNYIFNKEHGNELHVFNENTLHPSLSCGLPSTNDTKNAILLMGLCWFASHSQPFFSVPA